MSTMGALLVLFGALLGPICALADTTVAIHDIKAHDLQHVTFSVARNSDVQIEAVGAGLKDGDYLFAYPWIIDAQSRELIWSMEEEVTEAVHGSKWLRQYKDKISLRPGMYELYYYAGQPSYFFGNFQSGNLKDLLNGLGGMFNSRKGKDIPDDDDVSRSLPPRYYVQLTSAVELRSEPDRPLRKAPISILHPDNDTYQKVEFSITDDCDVEVYCIGEYSESSEAMVDGGWIVDARTRERIWEMTTANIDHAGGADKNRRFHDNVHLKKGDYIAYYVTDDSHSYDDWNAQPPVDPEAWGLQIFPARAADAAKIVVRPNAVVDDPLLRMTGEGDNELQSKSFRMKIAAPLRVYAIGEYDTYNDAMADYAWITRAGDRQKVWAMTGSNTEPAGGASKNRQFDGLVDLTAGDYTVYFVTDGSHSARDGWNSSPPYDQKFYGVTLYAGDPNFDRSNFSLIDKADLKAPGQLAAITEVGNDQDRRVHFTLSSPTRVHVHALGEGTRDDMADYGWIEDARSGDIVWEMTYRKTSHAGGAEKNRVVDQTILLDKGEYVVHFVTDDTHSFPEWNSAPPDDPNDWGIIVSEAGKPNPEP
jgi:hypothetical protein